MKVGEGLIQTLFKNPSRRVTEEKVNTELFSKIRQTDAQVLEVEMKLFSKIANADRAGKNEELFLQNAGNVKRVKAEMQNFLK